MADGFFVRATRMGFYRGHRRRPGVVFELAQSEDFKPKWMARTDAPPTDSSEEREKAVAEHKQATRGGRKLKPNAVDPVDEPVGVDPTPSVKTTGDRQVI